MEAHPIPDAMERLGIQPRDGFDGDAKFTFRDGKRRVPLVEQRQQVRAGDPTARRGPGDQVHDFVLDERGAAHRHGLFVRNAKGRS